MFFLGMLLATASNSHVTAYILPWHATWHIIGAFAFVTLGVFNHKRFCELPQAVLDPEPRKTTGDTPCERPEPSSSRA